ncbi:MAG: TRAP transporter small permease subunit [bacterium]|nr:TRAP transporter small permease subunit [bacterium]MCY3579375.1 TRAP transporter small permease subunit [bacterium]MCY3652326.1 TRAP transporter small permease subunit [bacterium]MDE0643130.1 TRAP transporter small permease subunit [bacterium]
MPAKIARGIVLVADGITDACGWTSRLLVAILIPVGFLNVFLRYVGRYTEAQLVNNTWIEAQWYLYGILFLLMFPYLLRYNGNVRVDFWYAERSEKVKARIDLIGHLIALIPFSALAIWVSWKPVMNSWSIWEVSPDPGGLPRAPLKALILVSFVLLGFQAIATLIRLSGRLAGHEIGKQEELISDAPLRVDA